MYHSLLIHSSADGPLICFHVLAIVNSVLMNIKVYVSLSIMVSLVCMPSSGIAGSYHMVVLFPVFLRNLRIFNVEIFDSFSWCSVSSGHYGIVAHSTMTVVILFYLY